VSFDLDAIAGRAGPITQVQTGKIKIKAAAGPKLQTAAIAFDSSHIIQQWDLGDELRLQVEVTDDATKQTINLVILSRHARSRDKYSGSYILKVTADGETKKFSGRIRQCEAG
jgi:hypothetical protein